MSELIHEYKFNTIAQRDQVIDQNYPKRECMDVPGCYKLPNGGLLEVFLLEAREFSPEEANS